MDNFYWIEDPSVPVSSNPDHHESDEDLMARFCANQDETALSTLLDRHMGAALALADLRLRHTGLSDDAVQETLIRLVKSASRYNPEKPFAPWFYSILRNVCIDLIRKEARYRMRLREAAEVHETSLNRIDYNPLYDGLRCLKDKDREIIVLRLLQDLSFREIAEYLGCSESAAKKRGQRAIHRLRKLIN